ncbi:MAG: hypothetical protein ACPGXL_10340 [Chitinophagales bacterium]
MLLDLPFHIPFVFILVVIITFAFLMKALRQANYANKRIPLVVGFILLIWLVAQGILAYSGFYLNSTLRFPLALVPTLFVIVLLFTLPVKKYLDQLPLSTLTYLHTVRIPVEIVLFWLFSAGVLPEVLTFEGRNWDVLSGLTAPFIAYFCHVKQVWSKKVALIWNFVAFALVFNVVIHSVFTIASPFQQLALDNPNEAILHIPFVWLPAFVVPVVWFAHFVAIKQLWKAD